MLPVTAYGPFERNTSNGGAAAGDGKSLTLNGTVYKIGLGVHAASELVYPLGGQCKVFTASVGVDDEVGDNGSVVFQVFADGTKLFDSGKMTGASATQNVCDERVFCCWRWLSKIWKGS